MMLYNLFDLENVFPLKNSELYRKMEANKNWLLNLSPDSMLRNFRINAGLDTKDAAPLKGWEDPVHWFRGHFMGHYLSTLSKSYATYKNESSDVAQKFKKISDYVINELKKCQDSLGKTESYYGYLAAVPSTQFEQIERLEFDGTWYVPYYNIHKTFNGLLDTYKYCNNNLALKMAADMAGYFYQRLIRLDEKTRLAMIDTRWYQGENRYIFHMEFGGMHEVLLRLYSYTKHEEHLSLAKMFERPWFNELLDENKDLLGYYSFHSNTELPCVDGLAEKYFLFGKDKDKTRVLNFMNWIKNGHKLPSGGVSGRSAYPSPADYGGELFEYPNMYYKHIKHGSCESCCSHTLNNLSRKLFRMTNDAEWLDEYEERFVNTVLAQQRESDAGYLYNLFMKNNSHKTFSNDGFLCCNGSGIENHVNLCEDIYYSFDDGLYIAQYFSSKLYWKEKEIEIIQDTEFPNENITKITIKTEKPQTFKIRLRISHWMNSSSKLYFNDNEIIFEKDKEFIQLEREFKNNDTIILDMPFAFSYKSLPDRPDHIFIYYGSSLLVACADNEVVSDKMPDEFLSMFKVKDKKDFIVNIDGNEITFRRIKDVVNEEYHVYSILKNADQRKVIDSISNNEESLKNHKFIDCSHINDDYILIDKNKSIEFELSVSESKNYLKLYFAEWEEIGGFNMFIEKQGKWEIISTQTLLSNNKDELEYIIYPIDERLTKNREHIKIRLESLSYEGNNYKSGKIIFPIEILKEYAG